MGNYEQLKQAVSNVIKTNGNQEITGVILQSSLLSIISIIGNNSTFAGIATPTTNPGTPDQNVFYIAYESGIYTNFGGIELESEVAILLNSTDEWNKLTTGICSNENVFNRKRYIFSPKQNFHVYTGSDIKIKNGHRYIIINNGESQLNPIKIQTKNDGDISFGYVLSGRNKYYYCDRDDVIQFDFYVQTSGKLSTNFSIIDLDVIDYKNQSLYDNNESYLKNRIVLKENNIESTNLEVNEYKINLFLEELYMPGFINFFNNGYTAKIVRLYSLPNNRQVIINIYDNDNTKITQLNLSETEFTKNESVGILNNDILGKVYYVINWGVFENVQINFSQGKEEYYIDINKVLYVKNNPKISIQFINNIISERKNITIYNADFTKSGNSLYIKDYYISNKAQFSIYKNGILLDKSKYSVMTNRKTIIINDGLQEDDNIIVNITQDYYERNLSFDIKSLIYNKETGVLNNFGNAYYTNVFGNTDNDAAFFNSCSVPNKEQFQEETYAENVILDNVPSFHIVAKALNDDNVKCRVQHVIQPGLKYQANNYKNKPRELEVCVDFLIPQSVIFKTEESFGDGQYWLTIGEYFCISNVVESTYNTARTTIGLWKKENSQDLFFKITCDYYKEGTSGYYIGYEKKDETKKITLGVWHNYKIKIKQGDDNTGLVEFYFDNQLLSSQNTQTISGAAFDYPTKDDVGFNLVEIFKVYYGIDLLQKFSDGSNMEIYFKNANIKMLSDE